MRQQIHKQKITISLTRNLRLTVKHSSSIFTWKSACNHLSYQTELFQTTQIGCFMASKPHRRHASNVALMNTAAAANKSFQHACKSLAFTLDWFTFIARRHQHTLMNTDSALEILFLNFARISDSSCHLAVLVVNFSWRRNA